MNTLSKDITKRFFKSDLGYAELRKFWSQEMQARKSYSATMHLLYKALIGKDWRTGFKPDSSGAAQALYYVPSAHWKNLLSYVGPFAPFITEEGLKLLCTLINEEGLTRYDQGAYKQAPLQEVSQCA